MSVFSYTATRNLAPGRTLNDDAAIELRLTVMPLVLRSKARRNTAIGGAVESILYREERGYRVTSGLIEPGSHEEQRLLEFFASTYNAEPFTFDRHGTIAEPDNPVSCIMESTGFPASEVGKKYHRYSWSFREA